MENDLIICVPGTWKDHAELIESIVSTTMGQYMLSNDMLIDTSAKDHVEIEVYEAYDGLEEAFAIAGQGKITDETLRKIADYKSIVYLHFPLDIVMQKTRLKKFTQILAQCGGIAIKFESSGIAHEWNRWFSLISSDELFDVYTSCVVLTGGEKHFSSCGMHHFGLPDLQVPGDMEIDEVADLINQFNYYQITEKPRLESGNTFTLDEQSHPFKLTRIVDERYPDDDLFYNPHGLWDMSRI